MAVALTLKSAIDNAQRVFDKKEPVCLDREFQVVTNLANRATFQELMERAKLLPESEGAIKKNRLYVILRLLYNEAAKKEPDTKALPATAAAFAGGKPKKVSKETASLVFTDPTFGTKIVSEEREIQFKLSLLLLGYDVIYMDFHSSQTSIKSTKLLLSIATCGFATSLFRAIPNAKGTVSLQIKLEQASNPKFSAFLFHWAKLFDAKNYMLNIRHLSLSDYEDLCRLRSHPDQEIGEICNLICLVKEFDLEMSKINHEAYRRASKRLLELFNNDQIFRFYKKAFPPIYDLTQVKVPKTENMDPTFIQTVYLPFLKKRAETCREAEKIFFSVYEKLYEKLHGIQKTKYPKQKEFFLKSFNFRLHDSYIPGRGVIKTFLPPKQLRSELSLDALAYQEKEDSEPIATASKGSAAIASEKSSKETEIPPSKIRQVLEKREFPFEKISYDPRVVAWFEKRKEAISGFVPEEGIWIHSFTSVVDQFLGTSYSLKDTWINTTSGNDDMRFCILADITLPSKETIEGVFQFTFDKNGICYHRCFAKMQTVKRFENAIAQIRQKIDFPPLVKFKPSTSEEIDQTKFTIDPHFESITFKDEENSLIIKIYKVRD